MRVIKFEEMSGSKKRVSIAQGILIRSGVLKKVEKNASKFVKTADGQKVVEETVQKNQLKKERLS